MMDIGKRAVSSLADIAYSETVVDLGDISGNTEIDLSQGNVFVVTLTGNVTFSFTLPSSPHGGNSFTLIVNQDGTGGHTVTWPGSVEWDSGSVPSATTTANAKDWYGFITVDSGTSWLGVQSAVDLS